MTLLQITDLRLSLNYCQTGAASPPPPPPPPCPLTKHCYDAFLAPPQASTKMVENRVTKENYKRRLHNLLYLEEYQQRLDMSRYYTVCS